MKEFAKNASWTLQGVGMLILLAGIVLFRSGFFAEVALAEGQPFDGEVESYVTTSTGEATLPRVAFLPVRIDRVWEGDALTGLEAEIQLENHVGTSRVGTNEPLAVAGAELHLARVDLAPVFLVRDPGSGRTAGAVVNLTVWSPGSPEDTFRLPGLGATALVRVFPNYVESGDGPSSASLQLKDPVVELTVLDEHGSKAEARALLRPGESLAVGAFEVELVELRRWGRFVLLEPRGLDLRVVGLVMLGLGLLLAMAHGASERRKRAAPTGTGEEVQDA